MKEKTLTDLLKVRDLSDSVQAYMASLVKVTWLMRVQDPPACLMWAEPGAPMDKDRFSFFTRTGKTMERCVWPAVLLHKGGPLLAKGIVQGK